MSTTSYAIETENLTKSFHGMNAVDHLDLHVPAGSIYGFIGENGSGKSTTEKLICGLLVPGHGSRISLYGRKHTDPAIRAHMGALIEAPGCFPNSTVYQNMRMQALNLGLDDPDKEIGRALRTVGMAGAANRKFKQCSLGMKQRIGIASALLGHPNLLILDEPINGLDADGMRIFRDTITDLNRTEGVTVLISSHILGELSKIATHYGIIRQGRLIREMTAAQMENDCQQYVLVRTTDDLKAFPFLQNRFPDVTVTDRGIKVNDINDSAAVSTALASQGLAVTEISAHHASLEEYYLSVMDSERKNHNA